MNLTTAIPDRSEPIPSPQMGALLDAAIRHGGKSRRDIGLASGIHKDTLRRILGGERVPTIAEAHAILEAAGAPDKSLLALFIIGAGDRALSWMDEPVIRFLSDFLVELPPALERVLGNQLSEIRPRWAKGSAHRLARLLSDHIDALEKRDDLYFSPAGDRP